MVLIKRDTDGTCNDEVEYVGETKVMQEMSYVHQSCLPRDALIAGRPGGFAGINRGEYHPG